ncbi:MAG: hypothetical protein CMB73_03015 [Euryarchaeota archaeon]|nr:hypothetical protein [Euryarchaeota archaeon]|tara:strand:- start:30514 stop:31479 length:966 start_codon:yes stop_codon:yes gene_type:complete
MSDYHTEAFGDPRQAVAPIASPREQANAAAKERASKIASKKKFVYPGDLASKHPVQTRISILRRNTQLAELLASGNSPSTQILGDLQDFTQNAANQNRTTDTVETALANIYLYVPSSVSINDALQYDNSEIGIIASSVLSAADDAIEQNASSIEQGLAVMGGIAGGAVMAGVTEGAKASGLKQLGRQALGIARNPRTEMLFKAPSLRQLSLNWKLMPTNQQESDEIYNMIQFMRAHAYPATAGNEVTFTFPDIFQIDFITRTGGAAQMIRFSKAYCTSVTTNYGPSGPAFFPGGKPVEIDLTMTFQETVVQTRETIKEGGY